MDPTSGAVLLDGADARTIAFSSLRERVVMVPQDGYLFDSSLAENVRFGRPEVTDAQLLEAFESLGLTDWLESLPDGLDSPVGQRGESLSAGERQLVALVRANIADPDLLVLDEATSAVDPGTEVRVNAALERLMAGSYVGDDRPPAVDRRGCRRGAGVRRGPSGGTRLARRTACI